MAKEHCLVKEAKEKCMCNWCKQIREWEKMSLEAMLKWEAYKIWRDCFTKVMEDKDEK